VTATVYGYANPLTDWFNVKSPQFGAIGNGTADDSAAVAAAVSAAISAGNTVVYLPAGTYRIGSPVPLLGPVTFQGAGGDATVLKLANGVNDYLVKFAQASGAITRARFADLQINGNAANQTAGGGILAAGAVECSFERVHFTSCYNWGLELGPQPGGAFGHHNRIRGCTFDGAANAGYGGGGWATSSDENFWSGCDFQYLGGASAPGGASFPVMLYDQAGLQHIENCVFVGSRGQGAVQVTGVQSQNANQTKLIGCTFDGVGGDNYLCAGTDCIVTGNTFTSIGDQCPNAGAAAGVHLQFGALRCTVTGNNLSSSGTNGRTGWLIYEQQIGSSGSNVIEANTLRVNGTIAVAKLATAGIASIVRSNIGYNPVGALVPPSVPGSGTPLVNPYNVDASVFIAGGTVTVIALDGATTGLTSGQFTIPAASSITLTYSVAPSWIWFGW